VIVRVGKANLLLLLRFLFQLIVDRKVGDELEKSPFLYFMHRLQRVHEPF
jgi:hypothetical protein